MTATQDQPADHPLMLLIVRLLAPMFLEVAGGDVSFACAAAARTVDDYRAQNHVDLLTIAQIIAFGLAALGLLGMSMADNLSTSMTLRLRAGAIASSRAGEACRRALMKSRVDGKPAAGSGLRRSKTSAGSDTISPFVNEPVHPAPPDNHPATDPCANVQASMVHTCDALLVDAPDCDTPRPSGNAQADRVHQASEEPPIDFQVSDQQPDAVSLPGAPVATINIAATNPLRLPTSPDPAPFSAITRKDQHRSLWANAMSQVAAQVTASLPQLSPAQRRVASVRAAALGSVARSLLTGSDTQPSPPFARPR